MSERNTLSNGKLKDKEGLRRYLGVGINTLNAYIYSDGFPIFKFEGQKDRYDTDAVDEWIKSHTVPYCK